MSQIKTAAPGGGRKMFLTSPFIDQAISLTTSCCTLSILGKYYPKQLHEDNCGRKAEPGTIEKQ